MACDKPERKGITMPLIRVEMLEGRSRDQKKEIAEVLTRELARILKCQIEQVQVIVREIDRDNWSTGGVLESHR